MDFVLIGAAVLFAFIGLFKGGAKLFFGIFMLLVIMVGTAFISAAVCPLSLQTKSGDTVKPTGAATVLMKPIDGLLPKDGAFGDLLNTVVTKGEDGVLYVGEKSLKSAVSENVPYVGSYLAPFVEKAAIPNAQLRESASFTIVKYIYETILWIILVIALVIARNIVRKKIFRFLDKNSGPSKIDRIVGLVTCLIFLLALFWGAGLVIAHFDDGANWAHAADTFILNGVISKPFFTFNPLLKLIHVTLPVAAAAE